MQLSVISTSSSAKKVTVSDALFAAEVNPMLIAQAVRVYQANNRQGTSKTKTRSEINRTKKKWFKQKGTGNARHGARTPNIFVGGGVSHGPNGLQNWDLELSQEMRHQALIGALTMQAANSQILDEAAVKTEGKVLRKLLIKTLADKKILVILPESQMETVRKIRNVESILVTTADQVTVYEVAAADALVFTAETLPRLEARLVKSTRKTVKPAKVKAVKVAKVEKTPVVKVAAKPKAVAKKPAAKPKTVAKPKKVAKTK